MIKIILVIMLAINNSIRDPGIQKDSAQPSVLFFDVMNIILI